MLFLSSDLGSGGETVKLLATKKFVGMFSGTSTRVELHTVRDCSSVCDLLVLC